jgi:hypothetical protein
MFFSLLDHFQAELAEIKNDETAGEVFLAERESIKQLKLIL